MSVETGVEKGNGTERITLPKVGCEADVKVTADESVEQRYARRIAELFKEADDRNQVSDFVGALTWTLASIAGNYGKGAAGDILVRFGKGLCFIAEQEQAEKEAEEARQNGAKAH